MHSIKDLSYKPKPVKFFICSSRLLFLFSVPRQLLPTRFVQAAPLQSPSRNGYQRNYLLPLARCHLVLPSEFRLLLLSSNVFSRSSCYNVTHKSLIVKGKLTHTRFENVNNFCLYRCEKSAAEKCDQCKEKQLP